MAYRCPRCGRMAKAVHTKEVVRRDGYSIWRRRECSAGHCFTTYETAKEDGPSTEPSPETLDEEITLSSLPLLPHP